MITVNKANPTPGEITSSLTGSTGDGAGLHFDGAAGYIDIASPPDLGTKFSFEFVFKATTWTSGDYKFLVDFRSGSGRFIIGTSNAGNNLKIFDNSSYKDTGVVIFDDLDVHHVVVTVDGTSALVYDNGNQVGSATISASHNIHTATDACIASNVYFASANCVNGTYYRTRFYNKALTSTEVQTAFERSDVPFADQYGSETKLNSSTCVNATSSNAFNTFSGASATGFTAVSTGAGSASQFAATADEISFVKGKKYSITFDATLNSGTAPKWNAAISILSATGTTDHSIATVTAGANGGIFTANQTTTGVISFKSEGGAATNFAISNLKVVRCGVVSDYELSANPTQSLTVQDRAGSADGTCSSSGVTQVQPVVQGNLKSLAVGSAGLAAGIPADGDVVVSGSLKAAKAELDATDYHLKLQDGAGNPWYLRAPDGDLRVHLNGTGDVMTFDSSGNVTVDGDITQTATTPALIVKDTQDKSWAKNDALGSLQFHTADTSGVGAHEIAGIHTETDEAGTNTQVAGAMVFKTAAYNNATPTERMRIDSTGDTTLSGKLKLDDASVAGWIQSNGSVRVDIDNDGSSTDRAFLVSRDNASATLFSVNELGLAEFSGGIAFSQTNTSATGATASSTTLSHYEEGTWTPVYAPSSGSFATMTMDVLSAKYTRVGNTVFVQATIRTDDVDITGGSGSLRINGLPFPVAGSGAYGTLYIGEAGSFASGKFPCAGYCTVGQSYITLTKLSGVAGSILGAQVDSLTTGTTANMNSLIFAARYTV